MSRLFDRIVKTDAQPKLSPKEAKEEARRLAFLPEREFKKEMDKVRGRGRPASGKETVTLRVESDVVAFFKTFGDDWKVAMNNALKKAAHL